MYLKLLMISVVLVAIAFMAFGIKLLFNRNIKVKFTACNAIHDQDFSCACGSEGYCSPDKQQ